MIRTSTNAVLLLALLAASIAARAAAAEVKPHAAYEVFCARSALCAEIRSGLQERFAKAGVETISNHDPRVVLVLYVMQNVDSRVNPEGVTVAIAYTSNIPIWKIASETVKPDSHARPPEALTNALAQQGVLLHLSAANLDHATTGKINVLLDQVVHAFLAKYPFLKTGSGTSAP